MWQDPELLADPTTAPAISMQQRRRALHPRPGGESGRTAGLRPGGYEDGWYYLWQEGVLPANVDVLDNKLKDKLERDRLRRIFEQGLDKTVGYALPLGWDSVNNEWVSDEWRFRRGNMFLLPGDSPMGLRLPLDALVWEPEARRQLLAPADPFAPKEPLVEQFDEIRRRYRRLVAPPPSHFGIREQGPADLERAGPDYLVRTALCIEVRDGVLHVFLPPLTQLEHWLDLIAAIEQTATELSLPVALEGYEPPHDPRLQLLLGHARSRRHRGQHPSGGDTGRNWSRTPRSSTKRPAWRGSAPRSSCSTAGTPARAAATT